MKKILVLLSTYNGEKYLREQIDSLLQQEDVSVDIVIRDDGSRDNTLDVINSYYSTPSIKLIKGENIGCAHSFLELMKYGQKKELEYDYFAFCDQDDYWMPRKLISAVDALNSLDLTKPCLYFSNLYVVDSNLNNARLLFSKEQINLSKKHSLIESFCTGCTMVFNARALDLYLSTPIGDLRIHDKRLFHMCLFLGEIYYDHRAFIKYRQHSNNVIGANTFLIQRLKNKWVSIKSLSNQHVREDDAKELLYSFNDLLSPKDREIVKIMANYRNVFSYRMQLLFDKEYHVKNREDNLWSKIRIIIGHI